MTDTTDSQQHTIVIVMKQENSTVIIHQNGFEQNYENEDTDYDQSESSSCFDDDNFDHNDVYDPSKKVEELQYLPEGKADEVEPEPEYDEKEEDYVVGYFSWKIVWAVAILCYILFRYRLINKLA